MKISIFDNKEKGSKNLALLFVNKIQEVLSKKSICTISLATGSSPITFYKELIKIFKSKKVDFDNIIIFNLDEFLDIEPNSINSYNYYMHKHLLNHIRIKEKNINLLSGNRKNITEYCKSIETKIKKYGGIDIQILGIGRNGHIGFNEPGSKKSSLTRSVNISHDSISILAKDFKNSNNVPKKAITLGIKTILSAKKIYLMAWGLNKSIIIKEAIEGNIDKSCPASFLQLHNDAEFFIDKNASSKLSIKSKS
tara:strand:- start:373 stop:1128 length:756 start_codon:yes stop_codon:yes gene_type:complete